MAFFRKIWGSLVKSEIAEYIGDEGNIFFNIDTGELRLSDGVTPGGLPIYSQGTGGNGVSLTIVGSVPLESDLDIAYQGAVGDTFVVQNTGNFFIWDGDQWVDIGVVQAPEGYTGSQGDVGFTGSQGDNGEQGRIGYTGSQGDRGDVGYAGSRGDIGFTGSKGAQGDIGYTGSQGIDGFVGSQGDVGFTGSQGAGFTGSQGDIGYTGSQGDIGYTGSQGAGFTGSQGDVGFIGSQGDIGYTGSQGDVGFTGSQGDIGYTGSVGYTGSQGDIGYTGSQGAGFTGSQGDTGFTGSQGVVGYTGSQGDVGFTGSVGYTGSQGDIGYTGSQGNTGMGFQIAKIYLSVADLTADVNPTGILVGEFAVIETGNNDDPENSRLYLWDGTSYSFVTDLSGAVGLTGAKGDTGYTGSAGVDGIIGVDGYTGSQGDTGFTGSSGDVGYTGSQGDVGYTGSSGDTGYTGSAGIDGSIGYTGSAVPGMVSDGSDTITIEAGYKIVPATDGLQSLGSPTAAWGEIYVSGNSIFLGGNIISINADGSVEVTDAAGDPIPIRAKNFYVGNVDMPAYTQGTDITGIVFPDGTLQTTSAPKMYTNADAENGLSLSDLKPGDYYYDDINAAIYICYDTGLGYFDILDLTVRAS